MGKFEAKIKEDVMQSIFNDTTKIYEMIETRFLLDNVHRDALIALCNQFNNDLSLMLKETKLA
ncbi:hypothetical protein [Sulfurospirillum diekertiae]|uniref:Uncharacterized protein n=1 Tax=Sulfurospirillum diekertiae TaxID=1854492 RepID=A0A1Y0HKH0_9BACT|nr:hypothetical protein [Sulfurospirillum diekertiae]ARU47825.1 hypothetical protein Sdiek1_0656 [Sulfurospirillum diekertiae]ASC92671.1 hypothetical protein Sdiek2_0647 [Sulfurospirillum diekertiae]